MYQHSEKVQGNRRLLIDQNLEDFIVDWLKTHGGQGDVIHGDDVTFSWAPETFYLVCYTSSGCVFSSVTARLPLSRDGVYTPYISNSLPCREVLLKKSRTRVDRNLLGAE